jgi:acetyl-CoA carboxylase biotin carboxyl carrier protein
VAAPAAPKEDKSSSGVEMLAPMSGTLYRKPAPGEPQFVKEGDKVVVGQSLCIIEV